MVTQPTTPGHALPTLVNPADRADGTTVIAVPPPRSADDPKPYIASFDEYRRLWEQSIQDPETFWRGQANDLLDWYRPFEVVQSGTLADGDVTWFRGGRLNVAYNCVDRHANRDPDRIAIRYEPDEPNASRTYTYRWLFNEMNRVANLLREYGLRKGDAVAIYMPMVPEAIAAMLACARIGCPHTVVFAGFSHDALRDRVNDVGCRVILTVDEGRRGGRPVKLKAIVDEALAAGCPSVQRVVVLQRGATPAGSVVMTHGRDEWWHEATARHRPYCPPEHMDAEDPLFLLYTSGSTGKPKGVLHTTAGYLLGAAITTKYVFDYHPGDVFGCTADIGWITGHDYIVYGPLCLGGTTVVFESIPTYPDAGRYWDMVAEHRITHFYTAPTAIRALRRLGDSYVDGKDLSSLRVIGTVGEPINPEAWHWYNEKVGRGRCALVDTYWQTETGSIILTPLPGAIPTKPGSATVPFFGIDLVVLDPVTGQELPGNDVEGVLAIRRPWPSVMRTVYNDHARYMSAYMQPYPGYYFTGDGCYRDADGYYWIRGRVDDVINVSGHRLSTAEIESALIQHKAVAETAVVGQPDELTGQAICAFVTLKTGQEATVKDLVMQVRTVIGPFAGPKYVHLVSELPKTRSGKIVRRVLRKLVSGEADSLGDTSTLADPAVIDELLSVMQANGGK